MMKQSFREQARVTKDPERAGDACRQSALACKGFRADGSPGSASAGGGGRAAKGPKPISFICIQNSGHPSSNNGQMPERSKGIDSNQLLVIY